MMTFARCCCCLLALAVFACGDSTSVEDGGADSTVVDSARDTRPPLPDGSPSDCSTVAYSTAEPEERSMLVGEMVDDTFSPYSETGHASFEWGFQGGTMITPRVAVPSDLVSEGDCVRVIFENLPDPAFPMGAEGLQDYTPVEGIDAHRVRADGMTAVIFDQIGWDDPTGWRFLLKVTVRGLDFALTETVALEIDPPADVPPQCLALETVGAGCTYRQIPGEATISAIEASSSGVCTDPRRVSGIFVPTDETHAVCYDGHATELSEAQPLMVDYADPPSSCLVGYDVGGTIPAVLEVIVAGGCVPWQLKLDVPACADEC